MQCMFCSHRARWRFADTTSDPPILACGTCRTLIAARAFEALAERWVEERPSDWHNAARERVEARIGRSRLLAEVPIAGQVR